MYNVPDLAIYFIVGGPPEANDQQNLWLGDVIGNKADKAQPIEEDTVSLLGYTKAAITRGMDALLGRCNAAMGASTTTIVSDDLVGYGDDAFNTGYQMIVLLSNATPGVPPEMEMRDITNYASDTGTFTVEAFSAQVKLNDLILIVSNAMASMVSAYGIADLNSTAALIRDSVRVEADNWWNGQQIMMLSGLARGQVRPIWDFANANGDIFVSPNFDAVPAAGDVYAIIPRYAEIVPRTIDDTQNALTSQVIGRKDDTTVPKAGTDKTTMGYLKAIAARGMGVIQATVTSGSSTVVVVTSLIGFKDNFFANQFYMQVIKAGGFAPEGRVRKITGYTSDTGVFGVEDFIDSVDTNDEILIIHESQLASLSPDLRIGDESGLIFSGVCSATHAAPTLNAVCIGLAGFGDNFFNTRFWIQIVTGIASPVVRKITDYDSLTGTFTWAGATANVSALDKIFIIHESLVAPTAGETADRFVSHSVGAKTDLPIPKIAADKSSVSYLKGLLSRGMCVIQGICTLAAPSANIIDSTDLVGYGTNFFTGNFYMQVVASASAANNEVRKILGYSTAGGQFITDAFSGVVTAGDQLLIIHESLVVAGRNDVDNTFDSSAVVGNQNGSLLERLELAQSHGITGVFGVVSTGGSDVTLAAIDLVGYGDDFFKTHFYVQVLKSALITIGTTKKITAYTSTTGVLTFASFGANFTAGDIFVVLHESLVAIGRNDANNEFDSSLVTANADGSALERLEDIHDDIGDASGLFYRGVCTGGSDTTAIVPGLIGFGDDYFNTKFFIQIVFNANSHGASPEPKTRVVTDYDTATGTFTFATVTDTLEVGDYVLIFHESLAATGRNDADNAFDSSAVVRNVDGSVLERIEDLMQDIMGSLGITTYPAVASPGNGVSIAQVVRAIIHSMVGGDTYTGYTNISGTANVSLDAIAQKFATILAANGVNIFNPTIQGAARTDLEIAFNILATYISDSAAAYSATVDPGGTARTCLETTLEDIGKMLAGGGITTYPVSAVPGNGVSMASVLRKLFEVCVGVYDSTAVVSNPDGSILEREEYIQTQLGYGARLLTEDLSTALNYTLITSAAEITEAAGFWKNALVICLTGLNAGQARPVIANTVDTVTVFPAFSGLLVAGDTFLLISAYKPQVTEQQADTAVNLSLIQAAAATNVFDLSVAGFSYVVNTLRVKSADPTNGGATAQTVTITLWELINDVLTAIDTFIIDGTNFGTYFSLMDMFGLNHLAGDNLKVTAALSAGATTPIVVTGQYQHSLIYTGAG